MEAKLKELGLEVYYQDIDALPIDFTIADGKDNVCWVWGELKDVEIECNHPEEAIDYHYDTDHHQGRCELCGAWCDVGHQASADDGYVVNEPFVVEWYEPNRIGGIVGDYIEELRKEYYVGAGDTTKAE